MKKLQLILFLSLFIFTGIKLHSIFSISEVEAGAPMPPHPPESNPHPPQSAQDIKRVQFAENVVKELLMKELPPPPYRAGSFPAGFQNKDMSCIKDSSCYVTDPDFTAELVRIHKDYGTVMEIKHAHIIPWSFEKFKTSTPSLQSQKIQKNPSQSKMIEQAPSKESVPPSMPQPIAKGDEYMIHIYAKFSKDQQWHHLDVIVTEDKKGKIFLRHFYTVPMPSSAQNLPPGAVC